MTTDTNICYLSLEYIASDIDLLGFSEDPATESLVPLIKTLDTFGRIFHNFTSGALVAFFKRMKRSELRAWDQSNALASRALFSKSLVDLSRVIIPLPDGMYVPYAVAVGKIKHLHDQISLTKTLEELKVYLKFIASKDPRSYEAYLDQTFKLAQQINRITREDAQAQIKSMFNDSREEQNVPASKVISSITELKTVHDQILTFEGYYATGLNLMNTIKDIENQIDRIIDVLNKGTFSTNFLRAFHSLVYNTAVQLDMYGAVLHVAQVVEHNFVLGINKISQNNLQMS